MIDLRLGKQDPTADDRDLRLGAYLDDATALPAVPAMFGPKGGLNLVGHWGMLGNDEWGDCAIAGPAHETMLLTKEGTGTAAPFTTTSVLADYARITGFNPNDGPPGQNPTDQGSNVRDVARYRRTTGLLDATGTLHKIAAFLAIDPRHLPHILAAAYLFDGVGLGIQVPDSAQRQFAAGQAWTPVPGASIEGGHYVPLIAADPSWLYVVTWGRVQRMSRSFWLTYGDESFTYLSTEFFHGGVSPDGFNLAQLRSDLALTA